MNLDDIKEKSAKFVKDIKLEAERMKADNLRKEVLRAYEGDDSVIPYEEIYNQIKNGAPRKVYQTGYASLDQDIGGFSEGDLVVLGGIQGQGKTNFCFNLTEKFESLNPFWLPFEETADELAEKQIKWHQKPLKFYCPKRMTREDTGWIEERILEAKIKFDSKIVFIDNLHFITMSQNQENYFMQLGMTAKALKKIAQKLKLVIVLIVHLRKTQLGISKMPTMDDIAGSSDVAKVANTVMILWRESKREPDGQTTFTGRNLLGVQKCRAGAKQQNHNFSWNKGIFRDEGIGVFQEFARIPGEF